jgi:hypothetical protein
MNDAQIEAILWRCQVTRSHFIGCFPADKIPSKDKFVDKYPVSMVINLDPARKAGSHWVALFLPNASSACYYDSLVQWHRPASTIMKFLQQFERTECNRLPYQSPLSDVCGQHCITFLYHMSLGFSFKKFHNSVIVPNRPHFDSFVHTFVNKLIAG